MGGEEFSTKKDIRHVYSRTTRKIGKRVEKE